MSGAGSGWQRRWWLAGAVWIALLVAVAPPARADTAPLMRYPNASASTVAFVARGELWVAPLAGGAATRLTDDPGAVSYPRFSLDGRWIAFTARRAGSFDVYVMPASGGAARRLTFDASPSGSDNRVVAWTPDSRRIVFLSSRLSPSPKIVRAFSVPVAGGLRQALPLDHSGLMSFAPDGRSVAFNRIYRNDALPKRYVGGQAQDIYTYDFRTRRLDRITAWKGTDTAPMWFGRTIYFLSDRGPGFRRNIWAYDLDRRTVGQVTGFTGLDVDEPSLGGHTITFAQGGRVPCARCRSGCRTTARGPGRGWRRSAPWRALPMPWAASTTRCRRTAATCSCPPAATCSTFPPPEPRAT